MIKKILILTSVLAVVVSAQAVSFAAWTGPTLTPPYGNVVVGTGFVTATDANTWTGTQTIGGTVPLLNFQMSTNTGVSARSKILFYQFGGYEAASILYDQSGDTTGNGASLNFYNNGIRRTYIDYLGNFHASNDIYGNVFYGANSQLTGNVGVGVTNPDANYRLTTSGGGVKAENSSATEPAGFFDNLSTGPDLKLGTGGIKFSDGTIQTTAAGAAGGDLSVANFNASGIANFGTGMSSPNIQIYNNQIYTTSSGMWLGTSATYPLNLGAQSATNMTILPGGNVGIGLTNPGYKLDVAGTAKISGNVMIDGELSGTGAYGVPRIYADTLSSKLSGDTLELQYGVAGDVVVSGTDSNLQVQGTGQSTFSGNVGIANTLYLGSFLQTERGYTYLPNGMILQWYTDAANSVHYHNGQTYYAFPMVFPHAVFVIIPKFNDPSTNPASIAQQSIMSYTTSGVTLMYSSQTGAAINGKTTFFAIGY